MLEDFGCGNVSELQPLSVPSDASMLRDILEDVQKIVSQLVRRWCTNHGLSECMCHLKEDNQVSSAWIASSRGSVFSLFCSLLTLCCKCKLTGCCWRWPRWQWCSWWPRWWCWWWRRQSRSWQRNRCDGEFGGFGAKWCWSQPRPCGVKARSDYDVMNYWSYLILNCV
jgi:hypothetical protein